MAVVAWQDWTDAIASGVRRVPDEVLLRAAELLSDERRVVVTAGNGGSSALASHAAQALLKPDYTPGGGLAAVCLTDNAPAFTAHANDGGWRGALAETAAPLLRLGATLLLFSSSGRSENICYLARRARDAGCGSVAFTGFDGEPLRSMSTISIHVDSNDYEVVEPVHDALLHRMQAHLRRLRSRA